MSSTSTGLRSSEGPCYGHWLAGQEPEEMLALADFLATYHENRGGLR